MSSIERLLDWDSWVEWEPTNNDLEPSETQPPEYPEDEWWPDDRPDWEPHPDMLGIVCSTGHRHVPQFREPRYVPPVGLARLEL